MGLLASHGLTHHVLLLRVACSSRWRRRRLACSSSSTITMAATPHRMLKWASCRSNSCLLNIVTTLQKWQVKQGDRLLYLHPYLGEGVWTSDDDCAITCRWLPDHPTVIQQQSTYLSTSTGDRREPCRASAGPPAMTAGQSPGELAVRSLVRLITVRVSNGDWQATADPVLTAVQGYENRPVICRCRKIGIRQQSAKNLAVAAGFSKACDVPFRQSFCSVAVPAPLPASE